MAKFLFYTDSHIAGESPRHRVDDFPHALILKLRETYEIAVAEGCDFVTFGGDFFNNHRLFSYDVISDVMDIICSSGLRTYAVVGEHDLYGHNIQTYATSLFAFFIRRCGMVEVLWNPITIGDVVLYGKHEPDKVQDIHPTVDPSKYNVLICHELLTCDAAPFDVIDTATLSWPFDLVLSGDLHNGYRTHKAGNTWYCNPGSLARRNSNEVSRCPQVAIVEVQKGKDPNIELRRLKSAKSGLEVFGESIAEVARENEGLDSFAKELLDFEAEATDVHDLVKKAALKAGLREEVVFYLDSKRAVVA